MFDLLVEFEELDLNNRKGHTYVYIYIHTQKYIHKYIFIYLHKYTSQLIPNSSCIGNPVIHGILRRRSPTVKPSDIVGYVQKIANCRIG